MPDAASQDGLRRAQATDFSGQNIQQLGFRVRPTIRERPLEVIPDAFVRVQLRGVSGKGNQMKAGRSFQEFLDGFAPMDCSVIQQHDDVAVNLPQQVAQKGRNFLALNVVLVELTVQGTAKAPRANSNAGNRGDAIMPIAMGQKWRLADRTPRLADGRNQQEAGFVGKDEVGIQPRGVFFTRGQTSRFQDSTASSFRSMARSSGFW